MNEKKVAVVTGGSRGIGAAMVKKLGEMGYDIASIYTSPSSKEKAEKVLEEIKATYGTEGIVVKADVAKYEECKAAVDEVMAKFGRIDVLINNGGITPQSLFIDKKYEDYFNIINVNLIGQMNMTHVCLPHILKQEDTCIVNVSSVGAFKPMEYMSDYGASKAGLVGFTRALALEVAKQGCRVVGLAPGSTQTDMAEEAKRNAPDLYEAGVRALPLGRFADPEEMADGMEYLLKAKSVTGFTLEINGGAHMN